MPDRRRRFSVITVSYSSHAHLNALLSHLAARYASWIAEMVIWENGMPGPLPSTPFPVTRICSPRNVGFARGVNGAFRALRHSSTPLLLLNPDAYPVSEDFFQVLGDALEHPRVGAAAPLVRYPDGTPQVTVKPDRTAFGELLFARTSLFSWLFPTSSGEIPSEGPVEVVTGAVLALRRDAFAGVGGMDERFFLFYEDHDLSRRLRQAGWVLLFVPRAVAVHQQGGSRGKRALWSQFQKIKSGVRFARKWESWPPGVLEAGLAVGAGMYAFLDFLGISFMKEKRHWKPLKNALNSTEPSSSA